MLSFLLLDRSKSVPRYYRVTIDYNLFGEYSVSRDWGRMGQVGTLLRGGLALEWFSNLREACLAAELRRKRTLRRGYVAEERLAAVMGAPLASGGARALCRRR